MLILQNRKHKLAILGVCLIGLVGFKDTGIFVKDYTSIKDDKTEIVFKEEERVNVLRETDRAFVVHKDGQNYEIPLDKMIQLDKKSEEYLVLTKVDLFREIGGHVLGQLNPGDVVKLIEIKDNYGYFLLKNGVKGYMEMTKLKVKMESNITSALANTELLLVNNGVALSVEKGKEVNIKAYKDGKYTLIDEKENEFQVKAEYIELRKHRDKVSRGGKREEAAKLVVEAAHKVLGKAYVYGAAGPNSFDCSGLTSYVYSSTLGIKLNRSSIAQASNGVEVKRDSLLPGDLVFFKTTSARIGHVGIYIGENKIIHAATSSRRVIISGLNETYYRTRYVTARRIIE